MLIPFKMGHKAAEITCNINTFGRGTANECTVQWWFQKFCKGDESLEDEEHSDWDQKLTMTNWEQSPKLILLQLHEKLLKNSMSTCGLHLKQIGKVKKLRKCCLMSWLKIKKIAVLKCWLLLFCATMNHFSIGLWHSTKSGFYTTTSDDQFSGWTEKFQSTSQSQTSARKRSWSKFGDLLSMWSIIAF